MIAKNDILVIIRDYQIYIKLKNNENNDIIYMYKQFSFQIIYESKSFF